MNRLTLCLAAFTILGGGLGPAHAGVLFSTGFWSAVPTLTPDRIANFDSLNADGFDLSGYTENLLRITVPGGLSFLPAPGELSFFGVGGPLTGFHYDAGGNEDFVTIQGTDNAKMIGLEFRYGNGAEGRPSQAGLVWKTFRDDILTGSGFAADLWLGTVVRWNAPAGFDVLQVSGPAIADSTSTFGALQSLALDEVRVQLSPTNSNVAPEPASIAVWGIGALGMGFIARRKKKLAV